MTKVPKKIQTNKQKIKKKNHFSFLNSAPFFFFLVNIFDFYLFNFFFPFLLYALIFFYLTITFKCNCNFTCKHSYCGYLRCVGMFCNVLGILGNVLGWPRHALQCPRHAWQHSWPTSTCFCKVLEVPHRRETPPLDA